MTTRDEEPSTRTGISVEQVRMLRQTRGLSSAALKAMPESALSRAIRRLDYPDMPRARALYRSIQSRDERGRFPAQSQLSALRQLDSLRVRRAVQDTVAGLPTGTTVSPQRLGVQPAPTAGLDRPGWVPIGPGNIGGRTRALVVHPTRPGTIWTASVGGGVWRTDDSGAGWQPVDDLMANLAVTTLAIDPTDSDVLYAGTGEGFFNLDALRGAGLFRTTDGVTWSQLPATADPRFASVNRIALNATGEVLLAGGQAGLFRSVDPGRTAWTQVLTTSVADVRCHPTDPERAVAGSLRSGMVWTTSDSGVTWVAATHGGAPWESRVEVAYAAADPDILYASINTRNGEIWRSADAGVTFVARQSHNADGVAAAYLGDQGWYGNALWAGDPTDADLVLVGGVDLWRSTDGGDTLNEMSTWWSPNSAHADQHAIVAHPEYDGVDNRSVLFGNDGGVYRAADVRSVGSEPELPRDSGWENLNNSYGVTQFYAGAVNTEGTIIGGTQDNGTLALQTDDESNEWQQIFGGDGGYCAADPGDPQTFYGEYVFLNIHRNIDGATTDDTTGDRYISGQFFNPARGWDWKPVPFRIPDAMNQRAAFIAPFVLDPNDSDRMLAGGESLWHTDDVKAANTPTSGPTWTRIKPPAPSATSTRPFNAISAIAIATGDSDRVWVGHEDGQVWQSDTATDAAPVWQRVDGVGPAPLTTGRFCTQIALPAGDPDVVLATLGGYVADNLWRSDDRGATWRSIGAGLPAAPVRAVSVHPRRSDLLYLGTEVGVFASEDGGTTWSATNEGPTSCSVEDLIWRDETLICVTHGRGMFTIDLSSV